MTIKLHIDTVRYGHKPDKTQFGSIKPRLQNAAAVSVTLDELMTKIQQGYTVSPAVMHGGIGAANWNSQQLFMVDIDNDNSAAPLLAVSEALKICEANHLLPVFYYHSFSHTEAKPKYRLVFVCEEVITDTSTRAAVIESLISLFPQADKSCNNADRLFLGTNKAAVICDLSATFSIENAVSAFVPQILAKQDSTSDNPTNSDLDRLKRDYDLLGYMVNRNGAPKYNNGKSAMFTTCELCGGHDDLVYYAATNTFKCFGARCNKGGSIIDYLMLAERLDASRAIEKFKYELCGLERPQFTREQKREYAIQKSGAIKKNDELVAYLIELQPHLHYSLNDKGLGQLFGDVYKNVCRYNVTAQSWYIYDGKVWIEDTGGMHVARLAKELADGLLLYSLTITDEERKKLYIDFVNKLGKCTQRDTMIKDSRDCYYIAKDALDKDLYLFNCQNGTLNLKTFEFKPHNPGDLLSKISNVVYDPHAESPLFEKFIDDVMMSDTPKTEYLQKLLGYALTGDTRLETCFILYGATTRNGKSTLVETYAYMLGNTNGYALNMKPETLAQKQNNDSRQASGDIARLNGCRFLNASEPPKRMIFDIGLLKTLLGRDSITARHLHQSEFEFIPIFKLFMNTNFLPLISDDTLFTSGRINVITFDRHFEPHEQDRTLKDKLKKQENLSGIFNWCLKGLQMFYEQGAEPPPRIAAATSEYRTNSDKVGNFIRECLEPAQTNVKALDVYKTYQGWCKSNGYGAENKGNFFAELKGKNMLYELGSVDGKSVKNVVKGYEIIRENWAEELEPPPEKHSNSMQNYF